MPGWYSSIIARVGAYAFLAWHSDTGGKPALTVQSLTVRVTVTGHGPVGPCVGPWARAVCTHCMHCERDRLMDVQMRARQRRSRCHTVRERDGSTSRCHGSRWLCYDGECVKYSWCGSALGRDALHHRAALAVGMPFCDRSFCEEIMQRRRVRHKSHSCPGLGGAHSPWQ
jgi:hypothetical protein